SHGCTGARLGGGSARSGRMRWTDNDRADTMRRNTMDANGRDRQVVVVTGASGGIGRAVARAFAGRGAAVGLLARGQDGRDGAAKDVESAGGRALPISVDTADAEALQTAADRVEKELGPIDVWVNVAFTSVFAPFSEISAEEFRRVTEVTYLGYVYATKAAL